MSSFTTGNERCISKMKVVLLKTTKYTKKELKQNRLIVKLTKIVSVPVTAMRLKILSSCDSPFSMNDLKPVEFNLCFYFA